MLAVRKFVIIIKQRPIIFASMKQADKKATKKAAQAFEFRLEKALRKNKVISDTSEDELVKQFTQLKMPADTSSKSRTFQLFEMSKPGAPERNLLVHGDAPHARHMHGAAQVQGQPKQ